MFTSQNVKENKAMREAAAAMMVNWSMDDLYDSNKIKAVIPVIQNRFPDVRPYRARSATYRAAMRMRGAVKRGKR